MFQTRNKKTKKKNVYSDSSDNKGTEYNTGGIKWQWLEEGWPTDSRPAILKDKKTVESMCI